MKINRDDITQCNPESHEQTRQQASPRWPVASPEFRRVKSAPASMLSLPLPRASTSVRLTLRGTEEPRTLRSGPVPLLRKLRDGLLAATPAEASVRDAHDLLLANGYLFLGFHGTNQAAFASIFDNGADPDLIGSNSGTAKGAGFYVSHQRAYADDWSEQATQGDDPQPPKYEVQYKKGNEGISRVVRVYVRDMKAMNAGHDLAWGMHPSTNDPNNDKKLLMVDSTAASSNAFDLEMVVSPGAYDRLAFIPSLGARWDSVKLAGVRARWPAHAS